MIVRCKAALVLFLSSVIVYGSGVRTEAQVSPLLAQDQPDQAEPAPSPPPAETPEEPTEPETDEPVEPAPPAPSPAATEPDLPFGPLARAPNMFGDFISVSPQMSMDPFTNFNRTGTANLSSPGGPLRGGARNAKISENDKALPQDRVFFAYNHFHNALEANLRHADPARPPDNRDFAVDRFLFGLEKTFHDGRFSVAVRMPFVGDDFGAATDIASVGGGQVGNLAVTAKALLYRSNRTAVAAGLGIDTPTGSDADGRLNDVTFSVENEAVHLAPFVGLLQTPTDNLFYQAFLQVDVPANGNPVTFSTPTDRGTFGEFDEQTLLFADASVGYWLYRDSTAHILSGLAPILELHYTTTLEDSDVVQGAAGPLNSMFVVRNTAGRLDALNLTLGLHGRISEDVTVRAGGVFPLRDDDDRLFDAEFQTSVNLFY